MCAKPSTPQLPIYLSFYTISQRSRCHSLFAVTEKLHAILCVCAEHHLEN